MSEDLSDPTPVSGEIEAFGYRPPRLRITATYDSEGTRRPTSLEVEVHGDEDPSVETIRAVVADVAHALTVLGDRPTPSPVSTSTWATGNGTTVVRYNDEAAA